MCLLHAPSHGLISLLELYVKTFMINIEIIYLVVSYTLVRSFSNIRYSRTNISQVLKYRFYWFEILDTSVIKFYEYISFDIFT